MTGFTQIKRREHLPSRIAAEIGQEIAEGRIPPGQKLPTEHLLAASFGVSRSVVREAIAQLRNEGLIETRQGVGVFATELQRRQSIRIDSGPVVDRESFRSLFQVRLTLETETARLAAHNRSVEDLVRIDDALLRMTGADKWTESGIVADLGFHKAIAAATGNEYYFQFVSIIAERIHLTINAARAKTALNTIVKVTIAEHEAIRDAIVASVPVAASTAMRQHLEQAWKRLGLELRQD